MSPQLKTPICFNQKDYQALIQEIRALDKSYYEQDVSLVPDAEYDQLMRKLRLTEEKMGWQDPDSPTRFVAGRVVEGFKEVQHGLPMLSLDNIFDYEELRSTLTAAAEKLGSGHSWIVEPKVDGISLSLVYEKGVLTKAVTRGNGNSGEDVLNNALTIGSIPKKLNFNDLYGSFDEVHIRGEVFITFSDFRTINEMRVQKGEQVFMNPRNAAGGGLRSHDAREAARRRLNFIPYNLARAVKNGKEKAGFSTQARMHLILKSWGFQEMPGVAICNSVDSVEDIVKEFDLLRKKLPFPTDGAVVKLNEIQLRKELGEHSKAPRWAWAYKYAPEEVETELLAITLQVGKSGTVAPVAELKPVEVAGSVISRATLHNADEIARKDIRVGDTVVVSKAGEIIPQIVKSIVCDGLNPDGSKRPDPWQMSAVCPSCGTKLVKAQKEDGEGVAWKCPNTWGCREQLIGRLQHWCSKEALDIEDVGPEIAEALYNCGFETPDKLYVEAMWSNPDLAKYGLKGQILKNLLARIDKSRGAGMERVLVGLSIPRVGKTLSRKAASVFPDINQFLGAAMEGTLLERMPDFGNANLKALEAWLAEPWIMEIMTPLCEGQICDIKSKTYNPNAAEGILKGMTFVFTGTMFKMERDAAHRLVESLGGKATGSVSKKTTHLVAGDECGATKLKKAKECGTKIITEDEFLKMVGQ